MTIRWRMLRAKPLLEILEERELLSLAVIANTITATIHVPFSGAVAQVIDTDPKASASALSVLISWGDGSSPTPAAVNAIAPGLFEVDGKHTYSTSGSLTTTIAVTDTNTSATATGMGTAAVLPQPLVISAATITGTVGHQIQTNVASFIDPNTADNAASFAALITWGDGHVSAGSIQEDPQHPGVFDVSGSNTYQAPGTFTTTISVGGLVPAAPSGSAMGQAVITAPPTPPRYVLTGTQVTAAAGLPITNIPVATFTDTGSSDTPANFIASINWGDGHVSPGLVTGGNGNFTISGSNTYALSGTYPIIVTLNDSSGNTLTAASQATVVAATPGGISLSFTGGLAVTPTNGPNAALGYTNTNQPIFSGNNVAPFSIVQLFATRSDLDATLNLGQTVATSTGTWSLKVSPLSNGIYTITAVVTPPGGTPSPVTPLANNGRVVIDTVAPQVVSVASVARTRQVVVTFRDDLSGMDLDTLRNTANYTFVGPRVAPVHPLSAVVEQTGGLPTDPVSVVLMLPSRAGRGLAVSDLRITGAGVTDLAGNALLGNLSRSVPAASGRAAGNFVARLGHRVGASDRRVR